MKATAIILFLLSFFTITAFAQNVKLGWANAMPGSSFDVCRAITLDNENNVYATGFFSTTVDFDPGPGQTNLTSVNAEDIFLTKYDSDGKLVWAKAIGDFRYQAANAIAVDSAQNIYIAGIFFGTTDFDPGPGVTNLVSRGNEDIFVCKYDKSGNFIWAASFGGPTNEFCNSIKLDKEGNIYFNGYFENTADFDPGPGTFNLTSAGATDIFVCKLNNFGTLKWAKRIGGPSTDVAYALELDEFNNVYSTGFFWSTVDFDPGTGVFNLTSPAFGDGYLLKLSTNGDFIKAGKMGGNSRVRNTCLKLDKTGHLYISGHFDGDAEFDINAAGQILSSPIDDEDIFVGKYDLDFNLVWIKQIVGSSYQKVFALETDTSQNIYLTGHYHGTVDFDPGPSEYKITATNDPDLFVLKLNKDGTFAWVSKATGPYYTSGYALKIDNDFNVYIGGTFEGTIDFDPGPEERKITSAGESEIFLMKLRQCPNAVITQTLIVNSCTSYSINNKTYDSSGTYTVLVLNSLGCDSINITLNLSISRTINRTDANICQGEFYMAGSKLQSRTGVYYDTLKTSAGCDSVIITNLTVWAKPKPDLGKDRNICAGENMILNPGSFATYLWQDMSTSPLFTVTKPGIYQVTVSNLNNCKTTASIHIRETAPIPRNFLPANQSLCTGNVLKLLISGFKSYAWSTGSTDSKIEIRQSGNYYLTVTSYDNCIGYDTISIVENNCLPVGIPNAFTPNSDGLNDIFKPTINFEITEYQLRIYNRNGQLIFRSKSNGQGWDGRFKGQKIDPGNYIYQLDFRNAEGKAFNFSGNILLIR